MLSQVIISEGGLPGFVSTNQRLCVNLPKRASCQINKDPEKSPFRIKVWGQGAASLPFPISGQASWRRLPSGSTSCQLPASSYSLAPEAERKTA